MKGEMPSIHHSSFRIHHFLFRSRRFGDGEGFAYDFVEAFEPGGRVRAEFDADCAAASRGERAEVAERLCLLERREGEGLAGYLNVASVRGRELHEDAAGRASLVQLPGRVQEARAVAGRRRAARRVAQVRANLLDD